MQFKTQQPGNLTCIKTLSDICITIDIDTKCTPKPWKNMFWSKTNKTA